jgi:tetratricopeptide (TPR) repeat protein
MDQFCRHLQASDQSDFSLAVSTIGIVGYRLIGHTVIDMLGLTDSAIARHPEPEIEGLETTWRETQFNSKYLLERQPDYILFSTGAKPSAPAERALYTYSAFLNNYRAIGFFYGSQLHPVFKRFFPITGEIERDVDIEFVQNINLGINQYKRGQTDSALASYQAALRHSPDPHYPYLYYFISEALQKKQRFEDSYEVLRRAAQIDTVTYEVYKDLYMYSYQLRDHRAADYYRSIVAELVPWYMPRLDSLVRGVR